MMSYKACENLVKSGDPDRYLASSRAPTQARRNLMAIYALNLEVARAPWASAEPMVAQMRLQWWADEISKIYRGETPDSHEILPAVRDVIFEHNLPKWIFERLISARNFDIHSAPHKGYSAFVQYIEATSGSVLHLASSVLGGTDEQAKIIDDFAFALGVANLLRAAPELLARGRHPLPENLDTVLQNANQRLAAARSQRHKVPASLLPAFQAGWRVDATLNEAIKRPENIKLGLLEESPAWRSLSLRLRQLSGRW